MKASPRKSGSWWTLLACFAAVCTTTGCSLQTTVGGQTLPSAYYLEDDVQFFPAGSEEQLPNLRRALTEYRLEQQAVGGALTDQAP